VAEISYSTFFKPLDDEMLAYPGFHWAAVCMIHGVLLVSVHTTCER